jgi:DnaJ domain
MLSVGPDAPADEIKKAFRREIARYHPDKVQHLGPEFQEMASGIAADLTEAYRILMDPALRAKYNESLFSGPGGAPSSQPPRAPVYEEPKPAPPDAPPSSSSSTSSSSSASASSWGNAQAAPRPASSAGVEFVKKVSLSRLKDAVEEVLGTGESDRVSGFDLAVTSQPKRGLFKKAEDRVRLLVKFVPFVDAATIADVWPSALKARIADTTMCVLLMGSGLAPATDLATAISEQRRKARNAGPVLVPVDVRDWEALFPPDTPAPVRLLVQRLKEQKR